MYGQYNQVKRVPDQHYRELLALEERMRAILIVSAGSRSSYNQLPQAVFRDDEDDVPGSKSSTCLQKKDSGTRLWVSCKE